MTDSEIILQAVQYLVPIAGCAVGLAGFAAASRERQSKETERDTRLSVLVEEQSKTLARIEEKQNRYGEQIVDHERRLAVLENWKANHKREYEKTVEKIERIG